MLKSRLAKAVFGIAAAVVVVAASFAPMTAKAATPAEWAAVQRVLYSNYEAALWKNSVVAENAAWRYMQNIRGNYNAAVAYQLYMTALTGGNPEAFVPPLKFEANEWYLSWLSGQYGKGFVSVSPVYDTIYDGILLPTDALVNGDFGLIP